MTELADTSLALHAAADCPDWTDHGRRVMSVSGSDARAFLQGLVTNDVSGLTAGEAVYAALLTPQGKYLSDFLIIARPSDGEGDVFWLDLPAGHSADVLRRLTMYKLRSAVDLAQTDLLPRLSAHEPGDGATAIADPRHPHLGWRVYAPHKDGAEVPMPEPMPELWRGLMIALGIPFNDTDLVREETFVLHAGLERAHGVDFRKGCYVGQEVTARMRHKAELTKKLVRLHAEAPLVSGSTVRESADGRALGTIGSTSGGEGLAVLRKDAPETVYIEQDPPVTASLVPFDP
ncbi:MAG: folate-binding protein [Pseudomonadota bacterium]